ncbi:MAG: asparagine synthase (glutamine-hydrolyzing), partial [Nitrosopumilus sp.]|nr:asparagine synthase (glutamine-hydrolyzing) [Nitrosopumilus sp.]
MCGISGLISKKGYSECLQVVKRMTDIISHRGPDSDGHWSDNNRQVFFGHRRLSIIDLTTEASQPMHYLNRYTIIFNGEIYNYVELKEVLQKKGYKFQNNSDTEVLMALYHEHKENCLKLLDGMFAFAIYDNEEQAVFFARDRFGEKPLYYSYSPEGNLLFSSEMKSLWVGGIKKDINSQMMFNYFQFNLLEDPSDKSATFFKDIYKFPAAHYCKLSLNYLKIEPKRYWNLEYNNRINNISIDVATEKFRELFYQSIQRRLRSDVPVGSSLSGGLDSSLIVSAVGNLDVAKKLVRNTFSARFPGFERDESYFQDLVINKWNVEPHFIYPDHETLMEKLEKVIFHQEEPFGSASICAQYEVFEKAKAENVTVLLDGQGADEILAGYHYYYYHYFNNLRRSNKSEYNREASEFSALYGKRYDNLYLQNSWQSSMKSLVPSTFKKHIKSMLNKSPGSVLNKDFLKANEKTINPSPEKFFSLNDILAYDTCTYGLETLLRYADRNSMAHSREVRLPFLNHELVEFVFSLPDNLKIKNGWSKWIMRSSFEDILPKEIAWRKDKVGYEPPQQKWFSNPRIQEKVE